MELKSSISIYDRGTEPIRRVACYMPTSPSTSRPEPPDRLPRARCTGDVNPSGHRHSGARTPRGPLPIGLLQAQLRPYVFFFCPDKLRPYVFVPLLQNNFSTYIKKNKKQQFRS